MLLDVALGILGSIAFARLFETDLNTYLIFSSIGLALLPDLDFLIQWIRKSKLGEVNYSHRELLHYPIFFVLAGFTISFLFDVRYGALFIALTLLHFLHDSIGIGWGVIWLYPFSQRSYKFFSEKNGRFSTNFLVSWTPEELQRVEAQHGDKDWLRNIYLRPHPIALVELLAFVIALGILVVVLYS